MKKILTIIALAFIGQTEAQEESSLLGSISIIKSSSSEIDNSKESKEDIRLLIFTDLKEKGITLTNTLIKFETKSEGKIYNVKSYKSKEKSVIHYEFDWDYKNNYDTISGTAKVHLTIEEIVNVDYSHWGTIIITDDEGLNLKYSGPFFFYTQPLIFQYKLEQKKNE